MGKAPEARGRGRPTYWAQICVADSEARGRPLRPEGGAAQHIGHKFVVGSMGLESVLLAEDSLMRGLGSNFTDNCSSATDRLSAPLLRCNKYLGQDS